MGWFKKTYDAVYDAVCSVFGLDPDSKEALERVVPAYLYETTTPQADRNKNVCYITVSERQGTSNDNFSMEYKEDETGFKAVVTKTIPVECLLTFYGPDADDDAEKCWSRIMTETGPDSPRAILKEYCIVPAGLPSRPVSVPEPEGTLWRRRSDVRLDLSVLDIDEMDAGYVDHIPDIDLQKG